MNIGGVLLLKFVGSLAMSAAAQAAYAVSYTQLFSFVTWTSVGLMGAAATVAGQNLGANRPDRADEGVHVAARFAGMGAAALGLAFLFLPRQLLAIFGMDDPVAVDLGVQLLRVLSGSGIFIAMALSYTGGLQGTGDTRSPLYISIISQIVVPLGICWGLQADHRPAGDPHLVGDPHRSRHPLHPVATPVQSGEMARDCCGVNDAGGRGLPPADRRGVWATAVRV